MLTLESRTSNNAKVGSSKHSEIEVLFLFNWRKGEKLIYLKFIASL